MEKDVTFGLIEIRQALKVGGAMYFATELQCLKRSDDFQNIVSSLCRDETMNC